MGDEFLDYAGLEKTSNQIARLLRDLGTERHDRVCLFLPKSPVTVAPRAPEPAPSTVIAPSAPAVVLAPE